MSQTPFRQRKPKPIPVAPTRTPGSSWESAVAAFLDNGRDPDRKLSGATIQNYTHFLLGTRTEKFRKEYAITIPAEMTAEMLGRFNRDLQDAGAAPGTIGSYHRCLKNFIRWSDSNGFGGDKNVWTGGKKGNGVEGPKIKEPEMAPFTADEKANLREVLAERPRDLLLVNLLLATGARLAEAAGLSLDDVVLDVPNPDWPLKSKDKYRGHIHIRGGKGDKDRRVPLSENVRAQLVKYKAKVRPDAASDALFLTERADGNGAPKPLTTSAIQSLMKRLSIETGLHINPHKFRHTFATNAIDNGIDLLALKKALGHSSLEMVNRYAHRSDESMQQAWKVWKD
jgi:site-specific recombinase XerD